MKKNIRTLFLVLFSAGTGTLTYAQDAATLALESRYKGENAVMTRNTEHVTISYDGDQLKAKSEVEKEVLLLTDIAPGMYNTSYVYHSFFHKLSQLKGEALIPNTKGGFQSVKANKLRTTHSESENIFYDDAQQTVVGYNGLVKYARTSLNYVLEHTDIHFLPSFYFQNYIPQIQAVYKVTAPKSLTIKAILFGNDTSRIIKTVEEGKNTVTYTWSAENMPRFKSYNDAPEMTYGVPQVMIYIADYTPRKGEKTKMFGSADDLYRFYYPFIKDINKQEDSSLKKLVAGLTRDARSPEEKARRIYQWVQQNIKYVAFEAGMGGFVPREASLVCNRKYGDCKDMSSLLVEMCREAGLNAYFTWIGTRSKPYRYQDVPLPIVSNHMICALKLNDKWIFLDGTDPTVQFGIPPYAIQGKEAFIGIDEKQYKIVTVPETDAARNKVTDSTFIRISGNELIGKVKIDYEGYGAWRLNAMLLYHNDNEKEKVIKNITSRGSNKYIQKNFDFKIADNNSREVMANSDFEIKDYIQKAGREMYINMNLLRYKEDTRIEDAGTRKMPVENNYKSQMKQVVVLDIPKGYRVTYLPPNTSGGIRDICTYKIGYKNTGKQVILEKAYEFDFLYLNPPLFTAYNKLVDELNTQYNESIVLTEDASALLKK